REGVRAGGVVERARAVVAELGLAREALARVRELAGSELEPADLRVHPGVLGIEGRDFLEHGERLRALLVGGEELPRLPREFHAGGAVVDDGRGVARGRRARLRIAATSAGRESGRG